jgi:hypothetical protein
MIKLIVSMVETLIVVVHGNDNVKWDGKVDYVGR